MSPSGFLTAAKEINDKKVVLDVESRARTVAGRIYYSAFLATRELVRKAYKDPDFAPKHAGLCQHLRDSEDPDVSQIGIRLDGLRALRGRADYQLKKPVTHVDAALRIVDASYIHANLSKIAAKIPPDIPALGC